jgi:hypothetical protein
MNENKLMEGINEETVIEVYENTNPITLGDVLKVAGITAAVAGTCYLLYKGGKKVVQIIKNKKNAEVVEAEYVEVETELEEK